MEKRFCLICDKYFTSKNFERHERKRHLFCPHQNCLSFYTGNHEHFVARVLKEPRMRPMENGGEDEELGAILASLEAWRPITVFVPVEVAQGWVESTKKVFSLHQSGEFPCDSLMLCQVGLLWHRRSCQACMGQEETHVCKAEAEAFCRDRFESLAAVLGLAASPDLRAQLREYLSSHSI